jgi:hypothetical protein
MMTITYHRDLEQGTVEWLKMREGLITASEMNLLLTPTLKQANNKDTRAHLYDLMSQRITGRSPVVWASFDMERGKMEEVDAKTHYANHYQPVEECGFITNDGLGFTIGYSPDGLIGDDGLIECKSRMPKFQVRTIMDHIVAQEPDSPIPMEFMLQVQTGLFVTGREWCDFISYSNGLNMVVIRVYPDEKIIEAIKDATTKAEQKITEMMSAYDAAVNSSDVRIHPVPFVDYTEMEDITV